MGYSGVFTMVGEVNAVFKQMHLLQITAVNCNVYLRSSILRLYCTKQHRDQAILDIK